MNYDWGCDCGPKRLQSMGGIEEEADSMLDLRDWNILVTRSLSWEQHRRISRYCMDSWGRRPAMRMWNKWEWVPSMINSTRSMQASFFFSIKSPPPSPSALFTAMSRMGRSVLSSSSKCSWQCLWNQTQFKFRQYPDSTWIEWVVQLLVLTNKVLRRLERLRRASW